MYRPEYRVTCLLSLQWFAKNVDSVHVAHDICLHQTSRLMSHFRPNVAEYLYIPLTQTDASLWHRFYWWLRVQMTTYQYPRNLVSFVVRYILVLKQTEISFSDVSLSVPASPFYLYTIVLICFCRSSPFPQPTLYRSWSVQFIWGMVDRSPEL